MGLFGFGKKKQPPLDEGEKLYRKALSADTPGQRESYLEQASALGNQHAKAALARYYWEHYSSDAEKINRAAALLDEAEAAGALLDSDIAGRIYFNAGRKDVASRHLLNAAKTGDTWAQFQTGWNFANGKFVAQDYSQAAFWYGKAAAGGNASAANNLAVLFSNGQGVSQDNGRACALWEQAAAQGSQTALGNLAWNYYHGKASFPQDDEKAAQYARRGMDSTDDSCRQRCRYVMAMLAGQNRGGVRNHWDNVIYALQCLADEGFAPAKEGLALLNQQEEERTGGLYRKALECGDMDMMDRAARNGSFDAELYLLKDAAKRLSAGETFTERELTKCMVWYHLTLERGKVPREVLWPILDAVGAEGYQMLMHDKPTDALYLVKDAAPLGHALCQYVFANAFFRKGGLRDLKQTEDGMAYCNAFLNNPESPKLPLYDSMRKEIEYNLFFLQLNHAALKGKGK